MPIDAQLATDATVSVNLAFQNTYQNLFKPGTIVSRFCMTDRMYGSKVKLPIAGMYANWRKWVGPRVFNDLTRYMMEVSPEDYELSYEIDANAYDDSEADRFYIFRPVPEQLMARAELLPRQILVNLVKAGHNTNCWDGQFYFDTDHPIDPAGLISGTYSNLRTTSPLNSANLNAAIQQMETWKLPNGDFQTITTDMITLVVAPQNRANARALLNAPTLPAGGSNQDYQLVKWEVWPELSSAPDDWYLLVEDSTGAKPFVIMERKSPDVQILNAKDCEGRFYNRVIHMGGHARYASTYGMPQRALKAVAA